MQVAPLAAIKKYQLLCMKITGSPVQATPTAKNLFVFL